MSNLECNHNQSVHSTHPTVDPELKHRVIFKLQQADLRIKRSAWLPDGKKRSPPNNHTDPAIHHRPTAIDGNCTLHTGDSLLAVDIDDHSEFPNEIRSQLPDTFTIQSPHGGEHLLYHVADDRDITSVSLSDGAGDIQYDGKYVVCPGSYIDHSECRDRPDCPGHGTDLYLPNDQAIATITEADHPELLNWLRDLGGEQQSESNSTSTTPNQQQELPALNLDNAKSQFEWFFTFIHRSDGVGNQARKSIDTTLRGGTIPEIDHSDDGTIDRSHADHYALYRLYGSFRYRGDDPDEARQNTIDLFRYCVQEDKWHTDGQKRKLLSAQHPHTYIHTTMDEIQEHFDQGSWFRWYNWESRDDYTRNWGSGPSRLTRATVLASTRYLTQYDGQSTVAIEELEQAYQIDLNHVDLEIVENVLSSIPSNQHQTCPSTDPPISTVDGSENGSENACNRQYPIKEEIKELAFLLKPDRKPATYNDALSEMINDPNQPISIVMAYCPERPNGERYVYYLDGMAAGERDPDDAKWVKLRDRKLEPATREPLADGVESVQEVAI